jgi:K+-transporting ATPase KdpF subunit
VEERHVDGRSGLRTADHRRLRAAGGHAARIGAAVIANIAGGAIALLLLVYLFVALIRPERF